MKRLAWVVLYAALSAVVFLATWARDEAEKKIKAPAEPPVA